MTMVNYLRLKRYRNKFTIHVGFEDEKFPGLLEPIEEMAANNGWQVLTHGSSIRSLLSLLMFKKISPYQMFLSNRTKKLFFRFKNLDDKAWWGLLEDKVFMRQLDSSLEQDVKRTSAFLKRVGINLFLNTYVL